MISSASSTKQTSAVDELTSKTFAMERFCLDRRNAAFGPFSGRFRTRNPGRSYSLHHWTNREFSRRRLAYHSRIEGLVLCRRHGSINNNVPSS